MTVPDALNVLWQTVGTCKEALEAVAVLEKQLDTLSNAMMSAHGALRVLRDNDSTLTPHGEPR